MPVVLDGESEGLTRKAVTAALARDCFAMMLSLERLLLRCRDSLSACVSTRARRDHAGRRGKDRRIYETFVGTPAPSRSKGPAPICCRS